MNARQRQRRCRIDGKYPAVRESAAHDRSVQHSVAFQIIHVLPAPPQETQVLDALDGLADVGIPPAHGVLPLPRLGYGARASSTASMMPR